MFDLDPRPGTTQTAPPRWLSAIWEYTGLAGMALSIATGLFLLVAVGPWVRTLSDSFEVTGRALEAVDTTVIVIDDALMVVSDTLVGVDGVLAQTGTTLDDLSEVVLSTAGLLNADIPDQIDSIQAAMDGLIDTANVVDGILGALSFVGVDYNPAVPLDQALEDVNERLGGLGESLSANADELFSMTVSVNRLNDEISSAGDSLAGLASQIDTSRALIADYQETADQAGTIIDDASSRLTGQVWLIRIVGFALMLALSGAFSFLWWTGKSHSVQG